MARPLTARDLYDVIESALPPILGEKTRHQVAVDVLQALIDEGAFSPPGVDLTGVEQGGRR